MIFTNCNSKAVALLGIVSLFTDATDSFPFIPSNGMLPTPKIQTKQPRSSPLLFFSQFIDSREDCANNKNKSIINNNICVLVDDNSYGNPDVFRDDAQRISEQMGIPLRLTFDENNLEEPEYGGFSHALRLVPYEYGNNRDRSASIVSTYALAIEPLMSDATTTARRKRRATKSRSRHPTLSSL